LDLSHAPQGLAYRHVPMSELMGQTPAAVCLAALPPFRLDDARRRRQRLRGGLGSDNLDGGDDTDTAVFSGPRAAYTITPVGNDFQITGPDG
jgi:hypothetical protein